MTTENEAALKGAEFEKKISEDIFELCNSVPANSGSLNFEQKDVVVQIVCFDYGNKDKDPVQKVLFWKKDEPDEAIKKNSDEVSGMLPKIFEETRVFVYYNDRCAKDKDSKQTAKDEEIIKEAFQIYSDQKKSLEPKSATGPPPASAPSAAADAEQMQQ
jgi:hypothetical protein